LYERMSGKGESASAAPQRPIASVRATGWGRRAVPAGPYPPRRSAADFHSLCDGCDRRLPPFRKAAHDLLQLAPPFGPVHSIAAVLVLHTEVPAPERETDRETEYRQTEDRQRDRETLVKTAEKSFFRVSQKTTQTVLRHSRTQISDRFRSGRAVSAFKQARRTGRPPSLNLTGCYTNIGRSRYFSSPSRAGCVAGLSASFTDALT
jgi:hypothetical protein